MNIQIHGWKCLKAEKKRSKFERENKKGFGQDHRAGLQQRPRCSSHPSGPSAQSSRRGTTPHHPCLTQPFLPFQLILLPKRPNIMFFNFNSQFQRLRFGPISEQSIKPIAFSGSIKPCPFQPRGKCFANTPRCFQLLSQPGSLSLAHTVSCQKGQNLNQNLLILFPVTADQDLFPGTASPCLCKPSCSAHRKTPSASLVETKPAAPANPALCFGQSSHRAAGKAALFQ